MIDQGSLLLLVSSLFVISILYSSVGHGGASGYIAVMALCSVSPEIIKPVALTLNIVVSSVATVLYVRAGHFRWHLFWPFAATSIPASFIGGAVQLPSPLLKVVLGISLLLAAARLVITSFCLERSQSDVKIIPAMGFGAIMGLISGMTGIGGGIFLSPLLILLGWARQKGTAAVAALFILVNSMAGLAGLAMSLESVPADISLFALTVFTGGLIGAYSGSMRMPVTVIARTLATVLSIAGLKLIAT